MDGRWCVPEDHWEEAKYTGCYLVSIFDLLQKEDFWSFIFKVTGWQWYVSLILFPPLDVLFDMLKGLWASKGMTYTRSCVVTPVIPTLNLRFFPTLQNFKGEVVACHNIPRLSLHDVGMTPDRQRILAVGTLTESPDGLQPHQARREKRIVGMICF